MKYFTPFFTSLRNCCNKPVTRWVLFVTFASAMFISGYALAIKERNISFHDMIINQPDEMSFLVDPADKRIKALAAKLKTAENVYTFVRDNIAFDPSLPAVAAGEILSQRRGSCLGKAVLLCSLYRALGMKATEVRIVTGEIDAIEGIADHAWVEIEYRGACLQQDATDMFGNFQFDQFKGTAYTKAFVRREGYVFNDSDFAIVSRLNMMKGSNHPMFVNK